MNQIQSQIHITANSRLTQFLNPRLTQFTTNKPYQVGYTPVVLPLSLWWVQWENAALLRGDILLDSLPVKVLSSFESQRIWQSLLDADMDVALLNPGATAKQLEQAYCLAQEYPDSAVFGADFLTEETQLFLRLQTAYLKQLTAKNWCDATLLQQQRLANLAASEQVFNQQFVLHGFDEIPPFMAQWQALIEEKGGQVVLAENDEKLTELLNKSNDAQDNTPLQSHYKAKHARDEAQNVAQWAVDKLSLLQKTKPLGDIRIGILAPNVGDVVFDLTWALDETLYQAGFQTFDSRDEHLVNVSLGQSLVDVPLVKNALLTLSIFANAKKPCQFADWTRWLLSPYSEGNFNQRQKWDVRLRKLQWSRFKWTNLLTGDDEAGEENTRRKRDKNYGMPDAMVEIFKTQQAVSEAQPLSSLSLAEFVTESLALLERFNWAKSHSTATLSTAEYQQKKTFLTCLHQFGHLQLTPTHLKLAANNTYKQSFHGWLGVFNQYASEQVHQPQSVGAKPIQILGMLEAGGQSFDALWVLGLTDEAWPRMPKPNPFLPIAYQRDQQMPRCDAARELTYSQSLMARISNASSHIVWSYARQSKGQDVMASPLLNDALPLWAQADEGYLSLTKAACDASLPLNWVEDVVAPIVPLGQKAPGGTGILTAQNTCPLMAFMDYRLGTKHTLESVDEGMKSTELGTLVHKVLELFWEETKTQTALFKLSETQLSDTLTTLIDTEMKPLMAVFDKNYLAVESIRVHGVLMDWMALEKQRVLPFSVAHNEWEQTVEIGGITFHLKIDRIDKVDENLLVWDYKTGKASVNGLLTDTLEAPQLAIYLFGVSELVKPVVGLGYGILHADEGAKMNMLVDDKSRLIAKGIKGISLTDFNKLSGKEGSEFEGWSWDNLIEKLRDQVTGLAESVQQGRAEMVFRDEKDLTFAGCKLAMRLPEVNAKKWLDSAEPLNQEAETLV